MPDATESYAESYEAWRAERHASMLPTDAGLLERVVWHATGQRAVGWRRIVGGETNEVHLATLEQGDEVVVRISRRGSACRFESEQWAVAAARDVGVAVPEILVVERTADDAGDVAVCVERRIAGRSLHEVDDAAARERLTGLAGEMVARLHLVEMSGCGWVRPDGTAPAPSWERVIHLGATPAQLDALCAQAERYDIPTAWVRAAADEVERHDSLLSPIEPRLLHGDLSPNHVLTDGERITGLLDFEQAFAGDPAFELVRWDYFYEAAPVEWLVAGYERVATFGEERELRRRLGRLRLHLALIDVYGAMRHDIAMGVVRRRFEDDADWFGFTGM